MKAEKYYNYLIINNIFRLHATAIIRCTANISALWLGAALFSAGAQRAQAAENLAQLLPQRPVLIVVPNAAGGPNDIVARVIAPKLSETINQNIIIDNRASANGVIGAEYVAKATPNGTILAVGNTGTHAINATLYKKPLYDPVRDFAAVAPVMTGGLVFAIYAKMPVQNLREFIAYAKSNPGKVNAAIAGATGEIATNAIKMMSGADMNNVPYKGGIPAAIAVSAGESHMVLTNPSGVQPHLDSGRLRAIGVTGSRREPALPNVPTLAEGGLEGYAVEMWTGIFLPAKTPEKIVHAYSKEINRIVALPEIKDRLTALGYQVISGTAEEFGATVKHDTEKYRKIILDSKMQRLD